MTATVTLRPMTAPEYEVFLARSVREYAADKVRTGEYPAERAEQLSRAEFDALAPDGPDTAGMLMFTAYDGDESVGLLWLSLPTGQRPHAWVYEVWVAEGVRGRGYGRAIMLAAERELAARGVAELGLNVFGHNPTAIHLYDSLGYTVVTQQMIKRVPTDGQ